MPPLARLVAALVAGLPLVLAAPPAAARDAAAPAAEALSCADGRTPVTRERFRAYTVLVYRNTTAGAEPDGCVEVWRGPTRVFGLGDGAESFAIDRLGDRDRGPLLLGRDVTGDGRPSLVVRQWRGTVCCGAVHVIELGEEVRPIATLDVARAGSSRFVAPDRDGKVEFTTGDTTFLCWWACCNCSPVPRVILRWRDGVFRPALERMRRPAPAAAQLRARAAEIRRTRGDGERGVPVRLWREVLDLVYAGQAEAAWRLFDLAWPPKARVGKEEFLLELRQRLRESRYWREIVALNGGRVW